MQSLTHDIDFPVIGGINGKMTDINAPLRDKLDRTFLNLKQERASYDPHWKQIADFIGPRRPRFFQEDEKRGGRVSKFIIDSTATFALRTLQSGMMSGLTSPAKPWFVLKSPDADLAENMDVKAWLHVTTDRMRYIFDKSNLYEELPQVYGDMGSYGIGAMGVFEDFNNVIRCQSFPIGTYYLGNGSNHRVEVFGREYPRTAREMYEDYVVDSFTGEKDWSKVSDTVRNMMNSGNQEQKVTMRHVIMPNPNWDPNSPRADRKKYVSAYYERNRHKDGRIAKRSGFDYFPILCPRWERSGEDVYGTDWPVAIALGDIKQIQLGEKLLLKAIEKMADPPMQAPAAMASMGGVDPTPGSTNYNPDPTSRDGIRAIYELNPRLFELVNKQAETRERVRRALYEDLFLMLANRLGAQPLTATEVNERYEEKLLVLGPVVQQVGIGLLDPMVDITFKLMERQELLPPIPDVLRGRDVKAEYLSTLSQAQKMIGIGGVDRLLETSLALAQANPDVKDKLDMDQAIDILSDMLSVPPGLVRPDEDVAAIRQQRQQAIAAQQQAEMLQQGAAAARDLASADMGGNSALSAILGGQGA